MQRLNADIMSEHSAAPLIDRQDFDDLQASGRFGPWSDQAREMHSLGFCTLDIDDEVERDSSELIEELRASMAPELEDWEAGRAGAPRLQDGWREHSSIRRLALHSRVLDLLRHLYGREPFAFQTLNFAVGSEQAFHSDAVHFHSEPKGFMCGLWIPLADVEPDSGPLLYYPGSHRLPYRSAASLGLTPEQIASEDHPQRLFEPSWREDVERFGMEPRLFMPRRGQALIWHANLLHGGSPVENRYARRWSQVVHYYFEGCQYTTPMKSFSPEQGGPFLRDPFDIATGKTIGDSSQTSTSHLTSMPPLKQDPSTSARIPMVGLGWFWRSRRKQELKDSLKGSIDLVSPTLITGWIFHPEIPFSEVRLVSGSRLIASAPVDVDRPDVADHVGRSGCFGFALDIPDSHPIPTADEQIQLLTLTVDGRVVCPINLGGADAEATEERLRTALSPSLLGLVGHFDGLSPDGRQLHGWCYSHQGGSATVWLQAKGLSPRPLVCREHRPGMSDQGHPEQCGFVLLVQEWPEAAGREVWASFDQGGELPLPKVTSVHLPENMTSTSPSAEVITMSVLDQDRSSCENSQQSTLLAEMNPGDIPQELQAHWRVLEEFRQLLDELELEVQQREKKAYQDALEALPPLPPSKKRSALFRLWR